MTPERHEQIKKLFLAVCELDEQSRNTFLDEACADDADLRTEIESLLRYHEPATLLDSASRDKKLVQNHSPTPPSAKISRDQERFSPGEMVADRYRIVGSLGKGGMGEVYRADDLKLGQQVALKFLSRGHTNNPTWLESFYNEARLSMKVTHANVCRVHDIGEAAGEAFLSMEYVDGEDLASLLKRIGRLPREKSTQIARQMCYGLAAAHKQGVLHRDLKPANIMLDGRGQVRITDFGIAALAVDVAKGGVAGTPAYMAPELLVGRPATISSDIYSLGLVLYELVTGRSAFEGVPLFERRKKTAPPSPSTFVDDIDPVVERIILQCLDKDPENRPRSAYAVAAALPGGDPLADALAAGETPSPDIVASARIREVRPVFATACFAGAIIGLVAVTLLAGRTFFLDQAGLTRAPAVLEEKAYEVIQALGGTEATSGRVHGFVIDQECLHYLRTQNGTDLDWQTLFVTSQPPAVFFEYRQGEHYRYPKGPLKDVPDQSENLLPTAGITTVRLDPKGRLLNYIAATDRPTGQAKEPKSPDWTTAFELAGLSIDSFRLTTPLRTPPIYADTHLTWEGVYPDNPSMAVRVEGAALDGYVVYFNIVEPWEHAQDKVDSNITDDESIAPMVRYLLFLMTLFGGMILAWRNLRLGRGDRRGAWRLASLMLTLEFLIWIIQHRHVLDFAVEMGSAVLHLRFAIFTAIVIWLYYIALEPYVRRFWPHSIISWSRLLTGRLNDPLIGRDILIGCIFGDGVVLLGQFNVLLPSWTGMPASAPLLPDSGYSLGLLVGFRYTLNSVISSLVSAIWLGLILLMIMLLLRVTLRIRWIAIVAFVLVATSGFVMTSDSDLSLPWATYLIISIVIAGILTRVGLLAAIISSFTVEMLLNNPITADVNLWYFESAGIAIAVLILLLTFGLYNSLSRKSTV